MTSTIIPLYEGFVEQKKTLCSTIKKEVSLPPKVVY